MSKFFNTEMEVEQNDEVEDSRALEPTETTSEESRPVQITEQVEISAQEGAGLNRNLSGAQRRKLLKQKHIAEGKTVPKFGVGRKRRQAEKRRELTDSTPSASATPGTSAGKRGPSTSLGSTEQGRTKPLKKHKEGSYAGAASHLPRVTLTCGEYLGTEMPAETCSLIKKAIVQKICAIEDDVFAPRFKESFPRRGTVVFVCEDKDSETWLRKEAENLTVGATNLRVRVVTPAELRITKVITRLPAEVESVPDFLKLIRRQNKGVDPSRWAIMNKSADGSLVLGLDEPSVVTLRSRNLRLSVGVETVTFRLLSRQSTTEVEGEASTVNVAKE